MSKVYIGTSGFYYPHWVGNFYPPDLKRERYLSFYSQRFDTVEINSSFYHLPLEKTVETWKKNTFPDFIFSFKMSRFITHIKKLAPEKEALEIFLKRLKIFSDTKARHLILLQTPSFLKVHLSRLKSLLSLLPKSFLYAFEFRHPSWFCREVFDIVEEYNSTIVMADSPKKADGDRIWPRENVDTADFFYIRFHGSSDLYSSSYTEQELSYYANLINEKLANGQDVYGYFNNDAEGWAVENAKRLKNLLGKKHVI